MRLRLAHLPGLDWPPGMNAGLSLTQGLSAGDAAALQAAANGDAARLARWCQRRRLGEPLAYILGSISFRGHAFQLDRRTYITDPELTHLIDHLLAFLARPEGLGIQHCLEFGVGCGALILSVALESPRPLHYAACDLDEAALQVAAANAQRYGIDLRLWASDGLLHLPVDYVPDLIFADPPWGDADSLYDDQRDQAHYAAMPPLSVSPPGDPVGLHRRLLSEVAERQWPSLLMLNAGVLPHSHIDDLLAQGQHLGARMQVLHPRPGLSLLQADFRP